MLARGSTDPTAHFPTSNFHSLTAGADMQENQPNVRSQDQNQKSKRHSNQTDDHNVHTAKIRKTDRKEARPAPPDEPHLLPPALAAAAANLCSIPPAHRDPLPSCSRARCCSCAWASSRSTGLPAPNIPGLAGARSPCTSRALQLCATTASTRSSAVWRAACRAAGDVLRAPALGPVRGWDMGGEAGAGGGEEGKG